MKWSSKSGPRVAAAILAITLTATACGSDGSDEGSDGLPSTVKIKVLSDLTGPAGVLGKQAENGMEIALEEIEEAGILGDTKLELDSVDVAGNQQTIASEASKAAANDDYPIVISNAITPLAAAVAPIMQRQKVPYISSLSGVLGVNVGEYTYVLPTPVQTMQGLAVEHMLAEGKSKLGVLYDSSNPTYAELADKVFPDLEGDYDFEVVGTSAVDADTIDLSAPINSLLDDGADTIFLGLTGAQATTAIQQASQQGFDGLYLSTAGVAGGVLEPAGEAAAGVTWTNDFSAVSDLDAAVDFTQKYEDKFDGEVPIQGSAYGYDALWLTARALAEAGSTDREAVLDALEKVTAEGDLDSPRGDLTFKDRVSMSTGLLVQWDGTKETGVDTP